MKQLFTVFFFYFSFYFSFSQTTFPWNGTYGGAGASRTYTTTVSGTTMSATIVNSENVFTDSSPLYIAAGGVPPGSSCSGISATNQGMLIYTDWTTNTTKTVTVTITFSPAVVGPVDFSLFDINDDGFGSWLDKIVVSGTNSAGAAVNCSKVGTLCIETGGSVTGNNTPILTLNSGQSTACTCWGNNRVNVGSASDCISNVVIKYQSGNTNYNNPKQYVIISDLKANIPSAVAAPTSITGTTTICAGASTTLSVVGGSASSQWYTGSCGGTLVGTGTAITVSPSSTTTYYVRNGSSSCSPASACISATVTVNPVPPTPTISANGPTSICPGNSVILTSSAASGNTWNTGATTQSITVSTAGTYTVTNTASGCSATSAGTTITLNSATSISNKTSSICSGNTYTLTPSGSDNVVSGTTYTWTNVANSSISGASNGTTQNSFVQTLTNTSQIPQTITYTVTPTANGCSGAPFTITITVDAPLNGGTVSNDQTICSGDTPSLLTNTQSPSGGNGLGLANTVQIGSQIWMNTNLDALNYTDGQLIGTDFTIASGAYTWYNNDQPTYGVYAPLYNWFAVNTNKLCPNGWKVPTNADWLSLMNFVGTNEGNKLKSCRQVSSPLGGSCAVNALPRWDSHVSQYGTDAVGFKALPAGRKEIANFLYTGTRATFWSADNFTPGINGSSYYVNLAYNLGTAEFTDFTSYYTSSRWGLSVRCMASNPTNVNTSYTYAWQQDPGCTGNWTTISGATSLTYQPGALTQTTCFRRVTTDACGTVYSNTITITVNPKPVISNVTNSICSGTAFNATPTNGSGVNNNNIVPSGTTFSWTVSNNANVTGQSAQNNQTTISQTLTNTSTTSQIVVYTVTPTSGSCAGAPFTVTVTVNPNPTTPTISVNGPTTFCSGGSVTLTSSSATGNTWSTGETTQSITVSTAGNYTVTTTSNGCTSAASNATTVTINPTPSTPTISASGPTTFCSGGTVTLTSSSATGNTWSTGETTQSITVSTAGNYTVTTTSNGCTSPASNATLVTINPTPSTPTISANGPTTFCSGGSVTLSSSSATGNTWSTGETTQSITVSIAGTYTVSTTDANSCTSAIASISVFINPTVNTNFTQVGAICSGGSFTLPTTSTNGINGTWSPAINQNSTTTYTFTPNTGQCGTSTTMTITVNPSVTPTFTQVAPICIPGTLNALPTTSNNGITGSWSPSINNTSTTTYTFTPSISPGADCDQAAYICGTSTSYFVNNLNGPGANAEEPEAGSCMDVFGPDEQNSAWFTFSAATSGNLTFDIIPSVLNDDIDFILYELNTDNPCGARTVIRCNSAACLGNTGLSMTDLDISEDPNCDPGENAYCQYVQATAGSKYALLVNNCNTNQSFTLQFNNGIPNPITFSPPNSTSNYFNATTCSGQCASEVTMTIQVNSPTSSITNQSICDSQLPFSWNGLTFSSAGSQTATLIAANGCDSLATLNLTVNPNPTVSSLITNVNCFGSNTGAVNYSLTTGIAPFTVNPSPINLAAGNYIFLITDANGCTVNDIISISEPLNALTASITSVNTSCNGLNDGTVDLTVSGGTLPYSFSWNNGATSEDINNLSAGNYIVTITDANGCIFNTNTTVNNSSPTTPTISVNGPTTFCAGGNVILSSSSLSGNTWSTGETTQSITITTSGSYSVIVDSLGCSVSSASQTIVVNPAPTTPTISANGPTTFCAGGSVTLTSSSITGNTWSTGETTQSIIVSTSGNYSVTVDSAGCSATSSTISIIVNPNPTTPTITASQTTICAGQTATLTSSVVNGNSWSTNETTQSIAVSSSGTYLLFVSDANGCVSPSTSVTITVNPLPSTPTISANGPTTFCAGGSVTLTSSVASGNTWNTAETTQSIIVSTSGTYTVFYTDLNGCISPSASISIVVNPSPTTPTITANGPTSFCVGGSVTLTSSSFTGNTWSTGETTQSIIVSTSGNYSVTVDSSGCSVTSSSLTITVNPNPSAPTITASQTTICAGQTATLTSSVINGNSWSTNETTQSIAVSSSGTYLLFVSDANGCVSPSTSVTITVNPLPSTPTISANGPTTFCSGGNVTLTSSSTTGNTWSTGETTQSIIVTTSGTYTLTYIDGNGCVSTFASQVVTVNTTPTSPTITPSDPTTFCVGDSVILTSSASTGNTWSTGATTPSITVLTAGTYTVTVGNLGCSATSASVVVTLNPLPTTPTITASQTSICVGQSSTLTSSVTTGNTWSTGATTNSISVSTAGTYTLTVTDGNGCVSPIASVIITATPTPTAPTISASGPTTFCVGGSVTLSSNIATGNTWSNGATTQSITVTNSGTYSVLYTNSAGCISSTASQIVTVNPLPTTPTISASGPLTICSGTTITLTSSASTGNTWSNGATTQSITVGTAGTYTVLVTTSGCSVASNSLTITVSSAPITPTITSTATSLCPGQTATLTSSSAIGNTWSTGATTQSITVSNTGTYSVFYTNANGCNSANASTTITVTAPPTITVNSATICQGQNATLTANASATGGSYTWSPGGNTTSTLTVSPNSTTTYNVIYQLNGCTSTPVSGTVTVNATPNITFIANQVSGCVPLTVNFNNTTIGNPTNCQWSFSNGASVIGCQSSYTFTNPGCYDVTLTNTVGGCTVSQTLTDYICLSSPPNASFSTNPSEFTSNSQNVTFFNNSTGATSYLWNFGDGFTSTDENPAHLFTNTQGGYTISLTATNSLGCTDIYQIGIGYVAGVEYYIPNTFTPDGDGYNQTFQPVFTSGYDPFNFQMMIFNRWGELIFESYDASKGWDGSYGIDGRAVQDGIYTYKIVFKNPKVDERIIVTGHITLIR